VQYSCKAAIEMLLLPGAPVVDLIATTSPSAVAEHGQFSRDVEQCQARSLLPAW
jgi:hypothetical protein